MFDDFEQYLDQFKAGPEARKAPWILFRKGGDRTSWGTPGGTVYTPVSTLVQIGVVDDVVNPATTEGALVHALQGKYYGEPIVFVQVISTVPLEAFVMVKAVSAGDAVEIYWKADVALSYISCAWITYGGQLRTP
jgi:hypothetical protein